MVYPNCKYQTGDMIFHRKFGKGRIVGVELDKYSNPKFQKDDYILYVMFGNRQKALLYSYCEEGELIKLCTCSEDSNAS